MAKRRPESTYTLRVELEGIEPLVWRRLLVDGSVSLGRLHHYIQAAMGWTDAHLHEYEIAGTTYAIPHPEDDPTRDITDERRTRLDRLATVGDHFLYRYDFGDNWTHRVVVERVEPTEEGAGGYAYVAAGERACPPEDVGGASSYMQFVRVICERPASEEGTALLRWAGEDFDAERYDRHAANAALLRMAWNRWV